REMAAPNDDGAEKCHDRVERGAEDARGARTELRGEPLDVGLHAAIAFDGAEPRAKSKAAELDERAGGLFDQRVMGSLDVGALEAGLLKEGGLCGIEPLVVLDGSGRVVARLTFVTEIRGGLV